MITGTPTWRGTTQELDGTIMESVAGSSISGTSNIIPACTGGTCIADMIEQWAYIRTCQQTMVHIFKTMDICTNRAWHFC